jgi:hypothetical protein
MALSYARFSHDPMPSGALFLEFNLEIGSWLPADGALSQSGKRKKGQIQICPFDVLLMDNL